MGVVARPSRHIDLLFMHEVDVLGSGTSISLILVALSPGKSCMDGIDNVNAHVVDIRPLR